ncbi:hypothetical protein [Dyella tabacisoli]|uniref:Uncharacterized protein n=1 Tax=Dyella tabacisoli TaxID=2282381 RepID=A0A369US23_9GAMM|nr:hypothetical protein [Dyella tabacisoli]RDD82835.1 hypothetical protein DVJ77_04785 [Dyella tabacisoli]
MKAMLRVLSLCLLVAAAGVLHAQATRPEVGPQVRAYSGSEGLKVWVLRVGPRAANEALVQVGGVDHDWNMKIQKMVMETVREQPRYSLTIKGEKFVALILDGEGGGELYLPGEARARHVSYQTELSEQGSPEHFLTDYLDQLKTPH